MKIKSLLIVLTLALVSVAGNAHARKATDSDRKMVRAVMAHLGAIAGILSATPKDGKGTLDKLEVYIDKKGPALRTLIKKMSVIEKELDADARAELEEYAKKQPETHKLQESAMGFAMAHQGDAALMERFGKIMMKLDPGETEKAPAKATPPAKAPTKKR
jgi:hypothetical protein